MKIAEIPIVHTWGDLLAQKPLILKYSLKKGATTSDISLAFRLGIDRTEVKRYGYELVYCLAQNEMGLIQQLQPFLEPCVGPLSIKVEQKGQLQSAGSLVDEGNLVDTGHNTGIFVKAIPCNNAGPCIITLRQMGEHPVDVASVRIVVSAEGEGTWAPWADGQSGASYVWEVANPTEGLALPECKGTEPLYVDRPPDLNQVLPQLIPEHEDKRIHLAVKGNEFTVNFDPNGRLFLIGGPVQHFLTRWWVNGKPFAPKLEDPNHELSQVEDSELEVPVREIHFIIADFHPEYLGLKAGDRVGVQLLFCPGGFDYLGGALVQLPQFDTVGQIASISYLSNRIDFTYTGNPKVIQK